LQRDGWLKPAERLREFIATALLNKVAEVSARETDKLRHFTNMFCFNSSEIGPLAMIVVPNLV
jgi:hypothetical protein